MTFDKYNLTILITLGISIAGSIPLIMTHFHYDHFIHYLSHDIGLVLASFLTVVAAISYHKTRLPRMIFSTAAFAVLAIAQLEYLVGRMNDHMSVNMISEQSLFNELILVMTILFAIGLFYKRS